MIQERKSKEVLDEKKIMKEAIKEAKKAYKKEEVPVGAIIVRDEEIIARAHNLRETKKQACAHAEILAIEKACKKIGSWRLEKCDIYVTLEPCPMCAGAILNARIRKLYIGARDEKNGAAGSRMNLFESVNMNHMVQVNNGICEDECSQVVKNFFKDLRRKEKFDNILND